jgi:2-polyprenyl-6-methoxyphenol hydroxylase-like FAD-dependent oxidoreductase
MSCVPTPTTRCDVAIVGARCAGAATALLLARSGLSVQVVERGRPGTDTLSTHALMRGAVTQLHRWGLLEAIRAAGTPPIRTTTFHYGDTPVVVPIKARDGVDALVAPRRRLLDGHLAAAAAAAGARLRYGERAVALLRDRHDRVRGLMTHDEDGQSHRIDASLVIGADGLRSAVARLAGAAVTRSGHHATCVIYGHWPGLALEGYHWYFRDGLSAGAIATNDGTCVFAAAPAMAFRETFAADVAAGFRAVIQRVSPSLDALLPAGAPPEGLHGFPGHPGQFRVSAGPGWALVGDAGYFKDPATAHGITDALRDAELLADAVLRGGDAALREYEATRDALSADLFEVTDAIASCAWSMDDLSRLHTRLSEAMAAEGREMTRFFGGPRWIGMSDSAPSVA